MSNNRETFIKLVQANELTGQPKPNIVYGDGDLEETATDNGFRCRYNANQFIVEKDGDTAMFDYEETRSRFWTNSSEIIVTLY